MYAKTDKKATYDMYVRVCLEKTWMAGDSSGFHDEDREAKILTKTKKNTERRA